MVSSQNGNYIFLTPALVFLIWPLNYVGVMPRATTLTQGLTIGAVVSYRTCSFYFVFIVEGMGFSSPLASLPLPHPDVLALFSQK